MSSLTTNMSRTLLECVFLTADSPVEPRSFITEMYYIELDIYGIGSAPGFSGVALWPVVHDAAHAGVWNLRWASPSRR